MLYLKQVLLANIDNQQLEIEFLASTTEITFPTSYLTDNIAQEREDMDFMYECKDSESSTISVDSFSVISSDDITKQDFSNVGKKKNLGEMIQDDKSKEIETQNRDFMPSLYQRNHNTYISRRNRDYLDFLYEIEGLKNSMSKCPHKNKKDYLAACNASCPANISGRLGWIEQLLNGILLFPYKPMRNEYKYCKEKIYAYTMNCIEKDYMFLFYSILNCINTYNRINNQGYLNKGINCISAYSELEKNLSVKFTCSGLEKDFDLFEKEHLGKLYDNYIEFKQWVYKSYKIEKLAFTRTNYKLYDMYTNKTKSISCKGKNKIIYLINIALSSENFSILLNIFPEFHLIYKNSQKNYCKTMTLRIINYFKLIIARFEIFRKKYFHEYLTQDTLYNLLKNQEFNETIAIIGCIIEKIFTCFHLSAKINHFLHMKYFVLFIRAKYYDIFYEYEFLKRIFFEEFIKVKDFPHNFSCKNILKYCMFSGDFKCSNSFLIFSKIINEQQHLHEYSEEYYNIA
ncbi:hypothetical protein H311_00488 [Anncaliia algerae PRA109]|nr:hypothetical protein H311_00488 [Anncaliia algerae PRA109]